MASPLRPNIEGGHVEPIFVHFDDLDSMGFVHNARYAVMLERALTAYWEELGYTFSSSAQRHPDTFISVVEYQISYKLPVIGTGQTLFHFWVEKLGNTSVVYAFRTLSADGGTLHAEGRRVHVKFDPETLQPTAWHDETRTIYKNLMRE